MKNYISRSEVSNTEAKFLTEKTFLRLAEKYWGNEDAMKILSDIVPREGDTLRETIASISNRVCELELSMYEENAAINEIHYVLDIPVKIIGNSSPILYLRLNEFEKAISRMPEKLKSILGSDANVSFGMYDNILSKGFSIYEDFTVNDTFNWLEKAVKESIVTQAEKAVISNAVKKFKFNEYDRIKFIEEYTGMKIN